MPALLAMLLLLASALLAQAQAPLHDLLALIEQHNPELQQQRRLLATTEAAEDAGEDGAVLELLREQEQSWWKYFQVRARTGLRASPGEEGSGVDTRAALEFVLPLGDVSDELAIAKERRRQQDGRQAHAEKIEQRRLAYERKRAALRQQVLEGFAELRTAQVELAATQQTLERQRERQQIVQKRVDSGVVTRDELWQLTDAIGELERQAALLSEQIGQQRMGLALLAGEQWRAALGVLERQHRLSVRTRSDVLTLQ